jgi:anti-sigma B factor antagonist
MAFDAPLTIEQIPGTVPGATIFRISGPITLRNLFDFQAKLRAGELPPLTILDLSGVPYMDSAGMGAVINHYTHCTGKGARMVAVGVSDRVMELFKMTRVDAIIPMAKTVEAAEAKA